MSSAANWEYPEHQQFERVPTLDEIDRQDHKAVYAARHQKIRDDWVKAMEARLIKEKLDECYKTEGVNHCMLIKKKEYTISACFPVIH
ncbi:hypothetical protein BCR42DRAFT_187823 [Absidia repens]|uniref:NADH-ubiquinone oxidoreductase 12 kDa subunit n=1 Tax=Absidia repens TaxID=90262 RepID=A0A1X2IT41_9FUNG|nr:hypothetical protein BCR42DRAFT_187823 [Absidia repens]